MERQRNKVIYLLMSIGVAIVASLLFYGCGGSTDSGTGAITGKGTLKVAITDSPAFRDYSSVHINITKVMAVPAGKENASDDDAGLITVAEFPEGQDVDILKLHFVQQELGTVTLPSGSYNQVRLILAKNPASAPFKNYFILAGSNSQVALTTPSAQQSGLKVNGNFTVTPGVLSAVLLDFDPNEAIVKRGNSGQNNLKPTGIRLMQVNGSINNSASISGLIRTSPFMPFSSATVSVIPRGPAASAASTGTVYANYSGAGVWKTPFVNYVPPNNTTAMPSVHYRVFIQGYRDTLRQVPAFQPYSSPLMTLTNGGVDYPVLPNGIVTLTP